MTGHLESEVGEFEPAPLAPSTKHATKSALNNLKPVKVESLPEQDRKCNICMRDYYVQSAGPRSPYVETVKDEDDYVSIPVQVQGMLILGQDDRMAASEEPPEGREEEAEIPLEMMCGHVFGAKCTVALQIL